MTNDQKTMARSLVQVAMVPGIPTKRFARDMALRAEQAEPKPLTAAQAEYLRTAVIRYRKNIPAAVVALAEALAPAP